MDYQPSPEGKDPHLWHVARKRASFKSHFATYIIVNIFLWGLWYFNNDDNSGRNTSMAGVSILGWRIGVVFHYIDAYVSGV